MFECCVDNLNSRRQHHNWSGDDTITLVSGWSWWCQPKEDQQWWSLSALCQRHACCSAHWVRLVTWSNIWDSHDKVRIRERIAVFCFYCLFFLLLLLLSFRLLLFLIFIFLLLLLLPLPPLLFLNFFLLFTLLPHFLTPTIYIIPLPSHSFSYHPSIPLFFSSY